ncbi:Uma2 family endonuclease [Endothiovibrio diazotrophicus]
MSVPDKVRYIEVEEYLEGELRSEVRHEYVDGQVFAMAGAGERHNRIAGNLFFHLRAAARGGPCGVFVNDMKARIDSRNIFYYPDVMLVCDPADDEEYLKRCPCLIAEVASPSTWMTDRREKLFAYRDLPSLRYYLLVSAERREVEYFVREEDGGWATARLEEGEVLEVACNDYCAELRLADLYEDVRL